MLSIDYNPSAYPMLIDGVVELSHHYSSASGRTGTLNPARAGERGGVQKTIMKPRSIESMRSLLGELKSLAAQEDAKLFRYLLDVAEVELDKLDPSRRGDGISPKAID